MYSTIMLYSGPSFKLNASTKYIHSLLHVLNVNLRSPRAIVHTLAPREVLNFTWDDPEGKKMIRWTFPSALKIHNRKPIQVIKVHSSIVYNMAP